MSNDDLPENIARNKESMKGFLEDYEHRFPKGLTVFISSHHVEIRVKHPAVMRGERCGDSIALNVANEIFKADFEGKFNHLKALINVYDRKQKPATVETWHKKYDIG